VTSEQYYLFTKGYIVSQKFKQSFKRENPAFWHH